MLSLWPNSVLESHFIGLSMGTSKQYSRENEGSEHMRETWEWQRGMGETLSQSGLEDTSCINTS